MKIIVLAHAADLPQRISGELHDELD